MASCSDAGCGGKPADNAVGRAFDLRLNLRRRGASRHLDRYIEPEFEISDPGFQHRPVAVRLDLGKVLHAVDAGGEETRIPEFREYRLAWSVDQDITGKLHGSAGRN